MKTIILFLFSSLLILSSASAWSAVAGFVLIAKGGAFATDQQGAQRNLKRRSKIMEGDVISTDANGMIQIRFVDKALLTLKANSSLDISAYSQAKEQGEDEQVVMNLITGGFRTITGSIGKGDKSAYKVKTPAASIGIRGTNYEVAQEPDGNFVMAVWDGGITVSNDQGSLDVGFDSDFIYVRVSENTEPEGLEEPPASFSTTSAPPPPSEEEEESKDDNSSSDESEDKTDKDGNSEESDEESGSEENTEEGSEEQASVDESEASSDTNEVAGEAVEDEAKESQLEEELEQAEEEASSIIEDTPLQNVELITSNDTRLSDWEYSYLVQRPRAALLIDDESAVLQNGLIVQDVDAGTDPVFIIGGQNTGTDNNLETFVLDVSNAEVYVENVDGNSYVSWGKWNGNLDILATPNDTNSAFSENHNFYWLSAEAASLSTLRGEAQFSGNSEFLGDINGEAITSLNGSFDVNFDTGAIENGNLNFGHANENWAVTYDGSVRGANATMTNVQGDITGTNACSQCVQGDIQGIFARPGDHFVGGYQLQGGQAVDGTSHLSQGMFSLKGKRP